MRAPIDHVEAAVLELWAKGNPSRDDVATAYRQALRAVLHVLDVERGVTMENAPEISA